MHSRLSIAVVSFLLIALTGCTSPAEHMAQGDTLYLRGSFEHALNEYQTARQADPTLFEIDRKIHDTSVRLYLDRGDRAVERGRWSEAERSYAEVRRLERDSAELDDRLQRMAMARADHHYRRGQRLMSNGNPFEALLEFEQALRYAPEHAHAKTALARAVKDRDERQKRAQQLFADGLRERSDGEFEQACKSFAQVLRLDPHHTTAKIELDSAQSEWAKVLVQQGESAQNSGEWQQAVQWFEQALALQPHHSGLKERLHAAQCEVDARDWFRKGEQAHAERRWRDAYTALFEARQLSGQPDRYAGIFLESRHAFAGELLAQARQLKQQGEYDRAIACYQELLTVSPDPQAIQREAVELADHLEHAEQHYDHARTALDLGDLVAAREAWLLCLQSIPTYRDVPEQLAAVEPELEVAATLYDRGCAAQRSGQGTRAQILFEECLSITCPFRDAEDRLRQTQTIVVESSNRGRAPRQYQEACVAISRRDYSRAVTLLEQCEQEQPGYHDVNDRLLAARQSQAEQRKIYNSARTFEKKGQLRQALLAYRRCSTYSDATSAAERIEQSLAAMRQARRLERQGNLVDAREHFQRVAKLTPGATVVRKRCAELDRKLKSAQKHYAQLLEQRRRGQRQKALRSVQAIRALCSSYRDVETIALELEGIQAYHDGCNLQKQGRHAQALECFERCARWKARHEDVQERIGQCRQAKS